MSDQTDNEKPEDIVDDEGLADNYYTILNVSRDATDKDITQAYHKFGLIYHPDKHKDPEHKRNAEILFSKVRTAYEVLTNPHKRAIYDSVGIKGLEQENLQLVVRSKSPEEIREEYERLSRENEERRIQKITNSTGHFVMEIDAKGVFDKIDQRTSILMLQPKTISISNFQMNQNLDFPLTQTDTVTIGGTLNTFGNYGNGSISASLKRALPSNMYFNLRATLGSNSEMFAEIVKNFTINCRGSSSVTLTSENGSIQPVFSNTISYSLDTNLTGLLQYKTSPDLTKSHMTTSLVYKNDNLSMMLEFRLGIKNSFLGFTISRNFLDNDLVLKSSAKYGYFGPTLIYGVEKQITEFSKLDASIIINSLTGVIFRLEVERGLQRFIIPVHLSNEVIPSVIFYGTITPVACYYVVKKMLIDPYLKDKEEKEAKRKKEKLRLELLEKKRLALAAQYLMKETVSRIIEKESPNGLIINKALYGKLRAEDYSKSSVENEKVIDVTIPVQFLVKDHTLYILSNETKSNLEGFYDPCIGETKTLFIQYQFNNESYEASFTDEQLVNLPKISHKVQWWSRPFSSVRS